MRVQGIGILSTNGTVFVAVVSPTELALVKELTGLAATD